MFLSHLNINLQNLNILSISSRKLKSLRKDNLLLFSNLTIDGSFVEYRYMEDEDLRRGLLNRRGTAGFDKLYEECMVRIEKVRLKNDAIQRQIGTEIEDTLRSEVRSQKQFIEKEIKALKDQMTLMENKFRDPQSKTKLKDLKKKAEFQISRNSKILKDLINKYSSSQDRSFLQRSISRPHQHQQHNQMQYIEGGKVDYTALQNEKIVEQQEEYKNSLLTDGGLQMEVDYELQRKILLEKNEMINEVEQSTLRINEIMNDMAGMVNEQGENLDIITDELEKTKDNVVQTNKNLQEASDLQKKSKRKYITLVVIILLIVIVVAGVIFFLVK